MSKEYFTGLTEEHKEMIAKWLVHTHGELDEEPRHDGETVDEYIQSKCGDTEIRFLYEDYPGEVKGSLVFISIDSGIEVVTAISKEDPRKSESFELPWGVYSEDK